MSEHERRSEHEKMRSEHERRSEHESAWNVGQKGTISRGRNKKKKRQRLSQFIGVAPPITVNDNPSDQCLTEEDLLSSNPLLMQFFSREPAKEITRSMSTLASATKRQIEPKRKLSASGSILTPVSSHRSTNTSTSFLVAENLQMPDGPAPEPPSERRKTPKMKTRAATAAALPVPTNQAPPIPTLGNETKAKKGINVAAKVETMPTQAEVETKPTQAEVETTNNKEEAETTNNKEEAETTNNKEEGSAAPWLLDFTEIEIGKALASGAFATVYDGHFQGHHVAVKMLKGTDSVQARKGFQCELDILHSTASTMRDHDRIIHTYGGCLQPQPCLVMEFCEHGSLYDHLNRTDITLSWADALCFARGIVEGVQIFHRDLKSHNILMDGKGSVKLCDFGLSRSNTANNHQSLMKARGSYEYMAPEVLKTSPHTVSADIYSIGIILWEIATRVALGEYQIPYKQYRKLPSMLPVVVKIMKGVRPTVAEGTPELIANLMQWCWHPDPPRRPCARELLVAIDQCIEELCHGGNEDEEEDNEKDDGAYDHPIELVNDFG